MRLLRFGPLEGRPIERFGSVGFSIAPLARIGDGQLVCARLEPGGRIGRHPAVGRQLLAVVAGSGTVSGGDGVERQVGPGDAVVWEPGEEHETRTDAGLTAIIVEGESLESIAASA
jgi:mannose-6-phosphate isomerase-like protein (cupin superfamily)